MQVVSLEEEIWTQMHSEKGQCEHSQDDVKTQGEDSHLQAKEKERRNLLPTP